MAFLTLGTAKLWQKSGRLVSVTFGAQWEEFTSLHHVADWLAAHGVRVSASTLYAMYYRHRWEGTERATGREITPLPVHVQICSTSDMVHLNRFMRTY